jgi:phosphatidate cytidylyltransferase
MAARDPSRRRSERARRRNTASDLGARVWIAIPAAAYAIAIIYFGGVVFAVGVLLLGLVCMHELFGLYAAVRPVRLAGFIALMGLAAAALWGGQQQVLLATVALIPLIFVVALLLPDRTHGRLTPAISLTLLGVMWIGLPLAHAIMLRQLPHGDGIVVDVLVGTFLGDTAAYLGGRTFGTRPLAARISPNKTVEGLLFGVLGATLAVWCAGLYQDWLSGWHALLIGAVVGVVAPIGDLFESKVKRDAGTKDTGTLFGAHGGALDRLDAALFTLVAGYYLWIALL